MKCAFLRGAIQRPVYFGLPAQDPKSCVPDLLGRLRKACMAHGMLKLFGKRWSRRPRYPWALCAVCPNSSVFRHQRRDILVVTADDFLCCTQRDDLDCLWKSMSKRYTLKSKVGPSSGEFREIEFLGRRLTWTLSGITFEADLKKVPITLEE